MPAARLSPPRAAIPEESSFVGKLPETRTFHNENRSPDSAYVGKAQRCRIIIDDPADAGRRSFRSSIRDWQACRPPIERGLGGSARLTPPVRWDFRIISAACAI